MFIKDSPSRIMEQEPPFDPSSWSMTGPKGTSAHGEQDSLSEHSPTRQVASPRTYEVVRRRRAPRGADRSGAVVRRPARAGSAATRRSRGPPRCPARDAPPTSPRPPTGRRREPLCCGPDRDPRPGRARDGNRDPGLRRPYRTASRRFRSRPARRSWPATSTCRSSPPTGGLTVFVLTHHAREPQPMEGGTTYHFVTDGIVAALSRRARSPGRVTSPSTAVPPPSTSTLPPA
jgi:hypothetical protein